MDLMLSLSQRCGLEGGLAQQAAPGGRVGGGWGGLLRRGGVEGWGCRSTTDLQGHKYKLGYSFKFT